MDESFSVFMLLSNPTRLEFVQSFTQSAGTSISRRPSWKITFNSVAVPSAFIAYTNGLGKKSVRSSKNPVVLNVSTSGFVSLSLTVFPLIRIFIMACFKNISIQLDSQFLHHYSSCSTVYIKPAAPQEANQRHVSFCCKLNCE